MKHKKWSYMFIGITLLLLMVILIVTRSQQVIVISHRGSPNKFPEHSFAGYDEAIKNGSDYIEQDLVLSKDNQLIVSHDNNLKRQFDKKLNISEMVQTDFDEIKQQNGESLHTMVEVFERYGKKVNYVIETKQQGQNDFKLEDELIQLIEEKKLAKQVIFQSFNLASLEYIRKTFKDNEYMLLADDFKTIENSNLIGIDIICINYKNLDHSIIETIHRLGKRAYAYTLNEEAEMLKLIEWGLDGFFTNDTELGLSVQN